MKKIYLFDGFRRAAVAATAKTHYEVLQFFNDHKGLSTLERYRKGNAFLKSQLPSMAIGELREGASLIRRDENFQLTTHLLYDCDECTDPQAMAVRVLDVFKDVPEFKLHIYMEISASGKFHALFPRISDNVKDDIAFYSRVLGESGDMVVTNSSRLMALTMEYLEGTCLTFVIGDVPEQTLSALRQMKESLSPATGSAEKEVQEQNSVPSVVLEEEKEASSVLYAELLAEVIHQNGVPKKGERNTTMFKFAVDLISIGCDQIEDLLELFRAYSLFGLSEQEARSCLASALRHEEPTRSEAMRQAQTAVLSSLPATFALSNEHVVHGKSEHTVQSPACVCDAATETESPSEGTVDAMVGFSPWQKHAPAMPEYKNLPPHIRALLKPIKKKSLWAHCISMSEPTLASLVKGTTFKDLHSDTWNLYSGLMCCGVAPTSSGKSSSWKCINAICEASGLYEIDLMARKELDDWRSEERKRSSSTTGSTRPRNYSQILGSSATQSAIVQRHSDLEEGRSLLMNTSEISCLSQLSGGTKDGKQLFVQNFDYDWFRTERSSAAADSSAIRLAMNISTCCPPSVCREFFTGEWLTGLIPRWNFCTIIRDYDEDPSAPLYGDFTGYADSLKPFLARLDSVADQQLDIASIRNLAQELTDKMLDYACATGSGALETLVRRSAVRFLRSAYLHYVLNGSKLTQNLREFLEYRWYYLIFSSMYCVGELIEKEHAKDEAAISGKKQNGPVNLLTYLPEDFDIAKLRALRVERKFTDNSDTTLKNQLRTWRNRKLISEVSPGVYRKCKK